MCYDDFIMTAINDNDISNAEVLEAVNNGFTSMEERMSRIEQRQEQAEKTESRHHIENQQEHTGIREELAALSKKVDQTVVVTDTHDRILQTLTN